MYPLFSINLTINYDQPVECLRIDRSGAYCFTSVRLSAVNLTYELNIFPMKGYLRKKSIHTSDSFLHSNYCGIMVSEHSIDIAYLYFFRMLTEILLKTASNTLQSIFIYIVSKKFLILYHIISTFNTSCFTNTSFLEFF